MNRSALRSLTLLAFASAALSAHAAPFKYIFRGTGSGTLGGATFTDQALTFVGYGDSDNIFIYSKFGAYDVSVLGVRVALESSFGTATLDSFLPSAYVDVDFVGGSASLGFGNFGVYLRNDAYSNAPLRLDAPYGPVSGTSQTLNGNQPIDTSLGRLDLQSFRNGSFEIQRALGTVPGPAAALPFALMALRRRKRA